MAQSKGQAPLEFVHVEKISNENHVIESFLEIPFESLQKISKQYFLRPIKHVLTLSKFKCT
jgi:hypothetical protein